MVRLVEQGTYQELLRRGVHCARLWQRQSGGCLAEKAGTQTAAPPAAFA